MSNMRLRHLAQVNPLTPAFDRLSDEDQLTFVPMEAVWPDGRLDISRRRTKSAVAAGYTRFQDGDVLVPKITPTFEAGRSILIRGLLGGVGAGTTELHVVRPGPRIDPRFLLYTVNTHTFLKLGAAEMYGVAGQQRVPDSFLRDLPVRLPPLLEQRRIADFLDAETTRIDTLLGLRKAQEVKLTERSYASVSDILLPGILSQSLNHWPWTWLPGAPTDRPLVRLGYVCRLQNGLTVDGKRDISGDVVTRPYLRVANVQAGSVSLDTVSEITVPREIADRSTLRPGDVLMTEGGDLDKLGRGTVWQDELPDCLHQNHVFALRPEPSRLDGNYLALMTRTLHGRCYFESTGTKTTNLASTNSSKIMSFPIPLPNVAIQRDLSRKAQKATDSAEAAIRRLNAQCSLLAERRQALITAAVTGQFDVSTASGRNVTDGVSA
ncbi:restriction endonuclease subunit S [Streptomyces sp. NBC_01423]|uniref:restriction endonuclease subunit S n=1 Tax=Streptomyces sp. NBC_01423 TaxID=2903860 RepID=UPI002E2D211F|nr:restriction endonuclease subunit S [Streptomyces sp. NBC_01423]